MFWSCSIWPSIKNKTKSRREIDFQKFLFLRFVVLLSYISWWFSKKQYLSSSIFGNESHQHSQMEDFWNNPIHPSMIFSSIGRCTFHSVSVKSGLGWYVLQHRVVICCFPFIFVVIRFEMIHQICLTTCTMIAKYLIKNATWKDHDENVTIQGQHSSEIPFQNIFTSLFTQNTSEIPFGWCFLEEFGVNILVITVSIHVKYYTFKPYRECQYNQIYFRLIHQLSNSKNIYWIIQTKRS